MAKMSWHLVSLAVHGEEHRRLVFAWRAFDPFEQRGYDHRFRALHGAFRVCGHGLGFWVEGLRFRLQGAGFRVQGSGFRVQGLGFMGLVLGFGV